MRALVMAPDPPSVGQIARTFIQGKAIEKLWRLQFKPSVPAGWPHQHRLEQDRCGQRARECQTHEFTHARQAWLFREPKAPERGAGGHGTEHHGSGQSGLQQVGFSCAPGHDVIDFEGHAHPKQQWERDDVGKIQMQSDKHRKFECQDSCQNKRDERQQHVSQPAQCEPQKQSDRSQRQAAGLDKRVNDGISRFQKGNWGSDCGGHLCENHGGKSAQICDIVGIPIRKNLDPRTAIRGEPIPGKTGRQVFQCDPFRLKHEFELIEIEPKRAAEGLIGCRASVERGGREFR